MIDLPRGSLSGQAHILVIVATVIIALFIFRLVRARQLRSKYALLWLVIGILLLPAGAKGTREENLWILGLIPLLVGVALMFQGKFIVAKPKNPA